MDATLNRRSLVAIFLVVALAACFSSKSPTENGNLAGECSFSPVSAVPGSSVIAIKNLLFTPAQVRIRAGASVTWINCEVVGAESHTSTADQQGLWSSPSLSSGASFTQTYPQPGTFTYHCVPHPFMTGTVVVE